jgi:hypothetical protein
MPCVSLKPDLTVRAFVDSESVAHATGCNDCAAETNRTKEIPFAAGIALHRVFFQKMVLTILAKEISDETC